MQGEVHLQFTQPAPWQWGVSRPFSKFRERGSLAPAVPPHLSRCTSVYQIAKLVAHSVVQDEITIAQAAPPCTTLCCTTKLEPIVFFWKAKSQKHTILIMETSIHWLTGFFHLHLVVMGQKRDVHAGAYKQLTQSGHCEHTHREKKRILEKSMYKKKKNKRKRFWRIQAL